MRLIQTERVLGAMSSKVHIQSSLLASMNWNNGAHCGSQSQNANNYRWNTNSNISAQFLADPGITSILTLMESKLAKLTPWLQLNSLLIIDDEQNTKQEMEAG